MRDRFSARDAKCSEKDYSSRENAITGNQSTRLTRRRTRKAFHVLILQLQSESSYQDEKSEKSKILLKYYSDVFPEELPSRLLSKVRVKMAIDSRQTAKKYK